ncbi:serine/threonine protein kinase [Streptomyces sp. NBC_00257]|uniref:serine/threonine-protein kinase n=1 Tax=unclassified Streptomyces TaxID=2593676 RepID=UPI002258347D|nr:MULTISPECIES: serine/threonine-protein kinase [unclassified Streptomyces]MCX5429372.1 serine/threonine protein kinase [Streptomyces sp. NBC_00062]
MAGARIQTLGGADPAVLGPYRLIGRLSSGGMGRIYLARSGARSDGRGSGELVAVKTLLAEGEISDIDRRRFAREVSLAQRVDSAHTARVREADPRAERPWMAIEYIAAPPLSELVRACGVLPASAVRWVAAGTAKALVALHGAGIVHRDVKPQNVLLPLDGPRLIDFGISHANDLTRTSLTLGTIAFTSPEQARGEPSTAASDMYSLGATLFMLATGRPPYSRDGDTLRLLARVQRGELDLGGLPKELVETVRPCLAADPGQRPAPAELLARFRRDQAGLPATDSGVRWLPPKWSALIGEYAAQGQALASGRPFDPAAGSDEQPTGMVPPPGPTRMYTADREAQLRERQRAARERERAAKEHERAERERAEKRAAREQSEREQAERAAQERAARERAQRERAERERAQQAARARARGAQARAASPTPGATRPTPAPAASSGGSSGWGWLIAVAAVITLLFWQPWATSGSGSASGGSRSGVTGSGAVTSGNDLGTHTDGSDTGSDSDSTSNSTYGSGSGAEESSPTPTPTPTPTPDTTDRAFAAVRAGDCLDVYNDGHDNMSARTPVRVGCRASNAYMHVNRVSTATGAGSSCDSGPGFTWWRKSGADGVERTLCLDRVYQVGQCFPAQVKGATNADLTVVWDCGASTVPRAGQSILRITGYYRAPAAGTNWTCPAGRGERFWYWPVNNGRSIICASAA